MQTPESSKDRETRQEHVQQHQVIATTYQWPTGLKSADEISQKTGIRKERILELAASGYAPHWRIDGGEPLFKLSDFKQWAAKNLLTNVEGCSLPSIMLVIEPPTIKQSLKIPRTISNIPNLRNIGAWALCPGIYFLCSEGEVVYVGQSTNPGARITTHRSDKVFDNVYFLPLPASELSRIEGALIRFLKPKYNGRRQDTGMPIAPRPADDDSQALIDIGLNPCP